jgi:hypothetical protein
MPTGAVEKQNGVGSSFDVTRDFLDVEVHCLSIGEGQRKGGADASGGTNGSKSDRLLSQRWSAGGRGRVPRLAHWRNRPFFWPMRASSSNRLSTEVVAGRPSR